MRNLVKIFGVLFILLFQLTSCLNDDKKGDPVYYFYDEPVVVNQMGEAPIVRNEFYQFYVPEIIGDSTLKEGNLLWSSFVVNFDDKKGVKSFDDANYYTAHRFHYGKVDSAKVTIPANAEEFTSYLSDDYSRPMDLSVLYNYRIDSLWFFGFRQKDHSNQNYVYELILNPEIEENSDNHPTLYIRSKSMTGSGKAQSRDGNMIFAFDVANFVKHYQETISKEGKVYFNLKYKTGVDSNGKDIYRPFKSNPLSWDFGKK